MNSNEYVSFYKRLSIQCLICVCALEYDREMQANCWEDLRNSKHYSHVTALDFFFLANFVEVCELEWSCTWQKTCLFYLFKTIKVFKHKPFCCPPNTWGSRRESLETNVSCYVYWPLLTCWAYNKSIVLFYYFLSFYD